MKTKLTKTTIEKWLKIASEIATIISCAIILLIYIKIPAPLSNLILIPDFGTERGEISLHIYNTGDFIHNGTIYLTLLERGIYKVDELHRYTGILSHNAGHTYNFKFNSSRIKPGINYTVHIRVEADGRVSTSEIQGQWD